MLAYPVALPLSPEHIRNVRTENTRMRFAVLASSAGPRTHPPKVTQNEPPRGRVSPPFEEKRAGRLPFLIIVGLALASGTAIIVLERILPHRASKRRR